MYIAGDLRVEHSIASMDFDKEMSPERYRNFMAAESAYVDLFLPPLERSAQLLGFCVRTVKAIPSLPEQDLFPHRLGVFLAKAVPEQSGRLKRWREQLRKRDIPAIANGRMIRQIDQWPPAG